MDRASYCQLRRADHRTHTWRRYNVAANRFRGRSLKDPLSLLSPLCPARPDAYIGKVEVIAISHVPPRDVAVTRLFLSNSKSMVLLIFNANGSVKTAP